MICTNHTATVLSVVFPILWRPTSYTTMPGFSFSIFTCLALPAPLGLRRSFFGPAQALQRLRLASSWRRRRSVRARASPTYHCPASTPPAPREDRSPRYRVGSLPLPSRNSHRPLEDRGPSNAWLHQSQP